MTNAVSTRDDRDDAVHPAAELFPLMDAEEFTGFVQNIRVRGLVTPIVYTPDGQLLDGRNRFRACLEAGVEVRSTVYEGDPWAYVISTNLHRRHLTDTQRAMVAARIAERSEGRPHKTGSAEPVSHQPPTRKEAKKLLNVSTSAIGRARRVEKHATPALKAATEAGKVPLATAARVASMWPAAKQDEFAADVERGMNPRVLAPPDAPLPPIISSEEIHELKTATVSPSATRKRRIYSSDVITREAMNELMATLTGLAMAANGATEVEEGNTLSEPNRWIRGLTEGISTLRRLRKLVNDQQERTA